MTLELEKTERGFSITNFKDYYGAKCSLQESSLVDPECIWFGIDNAEPMIMTSKVVEGGTGWVKYPLHPDVHIGTRMHLTREQVKDLLPILIKFVETGELK